MFWHQSLILLTLTAVKSSTHDEHGRGHKHPPLTTTSASAGKWSLPVGATDTLYCGGYGMEVTIERQQLLEATSTGWKKVMDEDGKTSGPLDIALQGVYINEKGGDWAVVSSSSMLRNKY